MGSYDPIELMKAEGHETPTCPFKISSDHSVTSIAWKKPLDGHIKSQSFKAVTSDGQILKWDSTSKPEEIEVVYKSEHNYYHTLDFSHDGGLKFACAGYLPIIEIFEEETLKPVQFFDIVDRIGHSNKVYAVKFDEINHNVMYSGGWDRNVVTWDIRQGGKNCGVIYGPLLSGDALAVDSKRQLLVTGSQKQDDGV